MRHRVYGKKLGRNKNERTLLFRSLVHALFLHGTIEISEAKAKAIKGLVDKVINLAKSKNSKRLLQAYFSNKLLQERLIKEVVPKLQNRTSGYTSLVRLGSRSGDKTMMVRMSLIGAEKLGPIEKESRIKNQESREKPVHSKTVVSEKKVRVRESVQKTRSTKKVATRSSKSKK